MTIDAFRASAGEGTTYSILPPNLIPASQIIEEQRAGALARVPAPLDIEGHVNFTDASSKNESLRLRRAKPSSASMEINLVSSTLPTQPHIPLRPAKPPATVSKSPKSQKQSRDVPPMVPLAAKHTSKTPASVSNPTLLEKTMGITAFFPIT